MHPQIQSTGREMEQWSDTRVPRHERRAGQRLRTVYRVARVISRGDQGLARVHNISDEGMMLSVLFDLCIGDPISVELSEGHVISGTVMWHDGARCGLKFRSPIDSAAVLKWLQEERRRGDARPLRLPRSKPVIVRSTLGVEMARLQDVSQAGMKLSHGGQFVAGLPVSVRLTPDIECRGVVRWSHDGLAGISLGDLLSVEQLGSMNAL